MRLRAGAHGGGAGFDDEVFPLREVRVEGAHGGAGRDAAELDVAGMTAAPGAAVTDAAEGEGNVADEGAERAAGRALFGFREIGEVDPGHGEIADCGFRIAEWAAKRGEGTNLQV